MVHSGIILLKYWLEISPEEQARRLEDRIDDGRKTWKLSPMDVMSFTRWDDYTKARDAFIRYADIATPENTSYAWVAGALFRTLQALPPAIAREQVLTGQPIDAARAQGEDEASAGRAAATVQPAANAAATLRTTL
jgi:hypothetical protein